MHSLAGFSSVRRQSIEWGDCDPSGLLLPVRCFAFFDLSSWLLLERALGIKRGALVETLDFLGIPLVNVEARALLPLRHGDDIDIQTHVKEFRRSSFVIVHRLTRDGVLVADAVETRVWAIRDDNDRIRAAPVPADIKAAFHQG